MQLRCIIVDDEQTARQILRTYIQDVPSLQLVQECKNAIDALTFLQSNQVDILFLDIEMPKLSGIKLAKIIDQKTNIIFTTAHRDFAVEGFELSAIDYLLKPFSFDRFLQAVQKVNVRPSEAIAASAPDHLFVKVNKQMIKIEFSDLLYIEGLSNYVQFHTHQGAHVVYEKLSVLTERLPSPSFMRVHKSFIINTSRIKRYTKEYVVIEEKQIPVSTTYRNALLAYLQ